MAGASISFTLSPPDDPLQQKGGSYRWYFSRSADAARFGEGSESLRELGASMQSWMALVVGKHPGAVVPAVYQMA
jgi:hypothetical protein